MNLKTLLKKIVIALLLYGLGLVLTYLIIEYIIIIPVQIAFALESSFFLTYLYSQFAITTSIRKGIQLNNQKKLRIYTIVWLIVMVVMILINYIIY